LSEDDFSRPGEVGSKSLLDAILDEDARDKNTLYTDTTLGNRIWQPILEVLPHNTTKVYFAPEGIFHLLAVENLPFDGKERFEMHRLTSIASLVNRNGYPKSERKNGKILIVGGLDYNKLPADSIKTEDDNREAAEYLIASGVAPTTGNLFANLKGTRKEVDSISSTLTNPSLEYEMDETLFKEIMPDYHIIHMATHGYCLNLGIKKRPEFLADSIPFDKSLIASGLALSGANIAMKNQGGQDELLSARELSDLDLSNVEFVVLSACQTAKGDITDEGPAGLVRGLKNAGVKTILATLWAVDDTSTMMFMQEFYKALECGKSKYQAYIQAQKFVQSYVERIPYRKFSPKTMAKEKHIYYKERTFSDPYYWAPFILIDEF
jgi:CHAT domain-containing protein